MSSNLVKYMIIVILFIYTTCLDEIKYLNLNLIELWSLVLNKPVNPKALYQFMSPVSPVFHAVVTVNIEHQLHLQSTIQINI